MKLDLQAFESEIFGRPVARLSCRPEEAAALPRAVDDWRDVWLVSCRSASRNLGDRLVAAGFERVECLVTFERPIPRERDAQNPVPIDYATGARDAEECADIARRAFVSDRFHADSRLPPSNADDLKASWARNAVNGRADSVVVAREDNKIAGFSACLHRHNQAVVDLIAVAPEAQRRGIGRRLVLDSLRHYVGNAKSMRVGTQETNTPSRRLYQDLGFVEANRTYTYHWLAR